jgi:hypothetical protein
MTTTTITTVTTTQQAAEAAAANSHVFTLSFAGGQIAIVEIRGAADLDSARAIAQGAVKHRRTISQSGEQIETTIHYTVTDGDATAGQAKRFYWWCSAIAQERQPLHPRKEAQA